MKLSTAIWVFALSAPAAWAQLITGQISGTVSDPGGAVIAGATVELTNQLTQQTSQYWWTIQSIFSFPATIQYIERRLPMIGPNANN